MKSVGHSESDARMYINTQELLHLIAVPLKVVF